jgi:hypothetical protein
MLIGWTVGPDPLHSPETLALPLACLHGKLFEKAPAREVKPSKSTIAG